MEWEGSQRRAGGGAVARPLGDFARHVRYLLSLEARERLEAFRAPKAELEASIQGWRKGCGHCSFLLYVYKMCGGSLGARDLAELSRPLHPLPWLLSPSQLTALLTSDGALVNVLQFGWKGDHITVHESVLSEDRLLVAFLTESLQLLDELRSEPPESCQRHTDAPGPVDLDQTMRRLAEKTSAGRREERRLEGVRARWAEDVLAMAAACPAPEQRALVREWCRLAALNGAAAREASKAEAGGGGEEAEEAGGAGGAGGAAGAEAVWPQWLELLAACAREVGAEAAEAAEGGGGGGGLAGRCARAEATARRWLLGRDDSGEEAAAAAGGSSGSEGGGGMITILAPATEAGGRADHLLRPHEEPFSPPSPARLAEVEATAGLEGAAGLYAPGEARLVELQQEIGRVAARRARLEAACEHGVRAGARRLCALVLHACWRQCVASERRREAEERLEELGLEPLSAPPEKCHENGRGGGAGGAGAAEGGGDAPPDPPGEVGALRRGLAEAEEQVAQLQGAARQRDEALRQLRASEAAVSALEARVRRLHGHGLHGQSAEELAALRAALEEGLVAVRAAEAATAAEARLACAICCERRKEIAFTCGHQTCKECAASLDVCPFCRRPIDMKISLFM